MAKTLFINANVFSDGAQLRRSVEVLVNGNTIEAVSAFPVSRQDAAVFDLHGQTLMPGLIDAHAHITGLSLSPKNAAFAQNEIIAAASQYLHNSLMDGFTSIREAGGAGYAIARMLARGEIAGPRMFYSG